VQWLPRNHRQLNNSPIKYYMISTQLNNISRIRNIYPENYLTIWAVIHWSCQISNLNALRCFGSRSRHDANRSLFRKLWKILLMFTLSGKYIFLSWAGAPTKPQRTHQPNGDNDTPNNLSSVFNIWNFFLQKRFWHFVHLLNHHPTINLWKSFFT
jgi:hypothetical protein